MYPSHDETQAIIKLHQQDLLKEAEEDRLLALVSRTRSRLPRRLLAGAGRWLVVVGTRLESRYADAQVSVALATGQESHT